MGQHSSLHLFTKLAVWGCGQSRFERCRIAAAHKLATSTNARVQESSTRLQGAAMFRRWGANRFIFVSLSVLLTCSSSSRADIELFVSPTGHDSAAGTTAAPLATIAAAQLRLRELRSSAKTSDDAHVWIAEGVYQLADELEFTEQDNARSGGHTIYEALPGHNVILRGGVTIPLTAWKTTSDARLPETSRSHVRVVDLATMAVDEVGHHPRRGQHSTMHPVPLELFSGKARLPVASWPNDGQWASIDSAITNSRSWSVKGLRSVDLPVGARAHGFWQFDWQDSCEPVAIQSVKNNGATEHRITIDAQHAEHVTTIRSGARFHIENLITELDAPGEWYHDIDQHLLYAWLPEINEHEDMFVSTIETPISFYDVNNYTIRGLTIEGARACCLEIAGGEDVCIEYCQIRHAGNLGAHIYHGQRHCIAHCEITSTGAGAIRVDGGHRETLQSSEHVIEFNRLHDYAQLQLAYRPAVNVYGVGVTVRHNAIFDAPHAAIVLHGNEHLVEYNDIHHVCQQTDDVGAVYLAHNPTFRGNVIRNNHIHDLGGFSHNGVIGIYLDDFASGTEVTHNVLERAGRGVAIGGGRDNVVENNLFLDCLAAVQIDCRGTTWAKYYVKGNHSHFERYLGEIEASRELYNARYPELANLKNDSPELAKGNRIQRNLFDAPIGIDLQDGLNEQLVQVDANYAGAKSMLAETGKRFVPQADSLAAKTGFEAIDLTGREAASPSDVRLIDKK